MKKSKIALLAFGLLLIPVLVFLLYSHFGYHNGLKYSLNEDGISYSVIRGSRSLTHADIPPAHNGKPVTAIKGLAFSSCEKLTAITLPPSITEIGGNAFSGCKKLQNIYISDLSAWCATKIEGFLHSPLEQSLTLYLNGKQITTLVIPENVTIIGDFTFSGMADITTVTFPQELQHIGKYAFSNCTAVPAFDLPKNLVSIGEGAFAHCNSITSFTLPPRISTVPSHLVYSCDKLTAVSLPEGVTSIGQSAFEGCVSLSDIQLPAGVTIIEDHAFYFCTSLSAPSLPQGMQSIGQEAFRDCYRFEHVSLPSGITALEKGVFQGCKNLKSVHLPEGLTEIHHYAFSECRQLQSISLPNGLDFLGASAFESDKLPLTSYENGLYLGSNENPYLILMKMQDTAATQFVFAPSAKFIHSNAFKDVALESIAIPDNIKFICRDAFRNCPNLKTIVLSAGVSCIEDGIFNRCDNLEGVHFLDPYNWWGYSHYYDLEKEAIPAEEFADPEKNVKKLAYIPLHQYYKKIQP